MRAMVLNWCWGALEGTLVRQQTSQGLLTLGFQMLHLSLNSWLKVHTAGAVGSDEAEEQQGKFQVDQEEQKLKERSEAPGETFQEG